MTSQALLNYTIIRKLGEGGMGEVYLALNPSIRQYVAIKRLHPRYANNQAVRERFRQEAIMLSSLSHPNIVKFLNYVENESGVFLIMEYVDGCTLEDFINNKNGLIVEERALPMIREMLDAFSAAHAQGIIHRDIKPSNIYITKDGHIKVLDFGIAEIIQGTEAAGGEAAGTPEYMSPEQVLGRPIDNRSDIYSLGVLIHQMLTGHAPYDIDSMSSLDVKRRVISVHLPPMKNYYPYISDAMQEVVDRATEKDPAERYADCREMLGDLPDSGATRKLSGAKGHRNGKAIAIRIAAVCVVVMAALGWWIWDYSQVKVKYYTDYAERYEIPEGIGKIGANDLSGYGEVYRMEFQKGKLRKMIAMNGNGDTITPRDMHRRPLRQSITEYFYTDEGKIDFKKVYNSQGKLIFKFDYEPNLRSATLKYDDDYGTPLRVGTLTKLLMEHDSVSGYLTRIAYADMENRSVKDKDSVAVMKLDYFPAGRLKWIAYLDTADNPVTLPDGYGMKSFQYDSSGRLKEVKFYDKRGRQTINKDGIAEIRYTYTNTGRLNGIEFLGKDHKAKAASNGVATTLLSYDKKGKELKPKYYDIAHNEITPKEPQEQPIVSASPQKGKPKKFKRKNDNPQIQDKDPYLQKMKSKRDVLEHLNETSKNN